MALRVADLEVLFTADTKQVEKADKDVKSIGERIEKKPITAKIDGDNKGAVGAIDKVAADAKKLVSQDTAIKLDADITRAEKSIARAKDRLEDLSVRAQGGLDVKADVARAEAQLSKLERHLKGLTAAKETIEVDADMSRAISAFDSGKPAAKEAGDEAGDAFGSNLINALSGIPIAGAVVGIGLIAGKELINAFNQGLQQEVQYDRLQALTGIDEATARRFGLAAGEAYANVFGESVEANMDTARLALQFDILDENATTASAQRVIQGLAGLADVLDEDVRPVAQAVSVLLSTGVAGSAQEAYDLIAAGARNGLNRSEDLIDTLTEYPALFQRLGLSGEQGLGLVAQAMAAGARNSDLAADALKEFQIRATDATDASAEGFRLLGLDAAEMTAQIAQGGQGAVDGLDLVLDRLRETEDPVLRNAAAVALFGTQAEDLGEALFAMDLSTAVDQLDGVSGSAQRMFDTLSDNDATAIEQAQRSIEIATQGIQGALAQAFSEPLGDFADWVSRNRGPLTQFLLDLANGGIEFGRSMVESSATATESLGEFVSGPLREAVVGIRDFIEWLPGEADLSGLDTLIDDMAGFDEQADVAAQTMRDGLLPQLDEAQNRLNEWGEPIVQMGYLNDASMRLAEAVGAVGVAADGSVLSLASIDLANLAATESGQMLEGQIRNGIAALESEISAAQAAGEGQSELAARYETGTAALSNQLQAMGLTQEQAQSLINTVLQTPTSATTQYDSNAQAQQAQVQSLADRIVTLPDGTVVINASTTEAEGAVNGFITRFDGRRIRVFVDSQGGQQYQVAGSNVRYEARGDIVEFMAQGGLRGLTPMQQGVATVVPPSTWRVVGDRSDVSEAYIPLDGSARSMAILIEAMRRMNVTPMADGGITSPSPEITRRAITIGTLMAPPGMDPRLFLRMLLNEELDETAGEVW